MAPDLVPMQVSGYLLGLLHNGYCLEKAPTQECVGLQRFCRLWKPLENYLAALALQNGRITTIDILLDPARLARLNLPNFDSRL
jgi:hypothetical protein